MSQSHSPQRDSHWPRPIRGTLLLLGGLALAACGDSPTAPVEPGMQRVQDEVVGVSLQIPEQWGVSHDPFLANPYGFVLVREDTDTTDLHSGQPVLRVALAHDATPAQIPELVQARIAEYPDLELKVSELAVGGEHRGTVVSGLPGATEPYTIIYVAVDDRVYHVGLWGELDARAQALLSGLEFHTPKRSVESLGLPDHTAYVERHLNPLMREDLRRPSSIDPEELAALQSDATASLVEAMAVASGCAVQPSNLVWQTQWWKDTYVYDAGWTRLSPGGYSYFGENYHQYCNRTNSYNQHYAVDYPLTLNASLYSAFAGKVTWAGSSPNDGYWSYGIFVVTQTWRDGNRYMNVSAHLNSLNGYRAGDLVDLNDVIGWAGTTGDSGGVHLHATVYKNPSLSYGRPYGGQNVKMRWMRCYGCKNWDQGPATDGYGGGWYTSFPEARWMKW